MENKDDSKVLLQITSLSDEEYDVAVRYGVISKSDFASIVTTFIDLAMEVDMFHEILVASITGVDILKNKINPDRKSITES